VYPQGPFPSSALKKSLSRPPGQSRCGIGLAEPCTAAERAVPAEQAAIFRASPGVSELSFRAFSFRALSCGAWALALAFGACAPAAPTPTDPASTTAASPARSSAAALPAGTVLTLNATPILVDEVDAIGSIVARVEVHHTLPSLRRIALTNVILPLVAARQVAGAEQHAAALARAHDWRGALARGETPVGPLTPPREDVLRGGVIELGLPIWAWALEAPLATWSEPIETVGAWRLVRVLERSAGYRPADVVLDVEVRTFVWDPAESFPQDLEDHLDRSKLEFVDESWRDVVPTLWQRRLRGSP